MSGNDTPAEAITTPAPPAFRQREPLVGDWARHGGDSPSSGESDTMERAGPVKKSL